MFALTLVLVIQRPLTASYTYGKECYTGLLIYTLKDQLFTIIKCCGFLTFNLNGTKIDHMFIWVLTTYAGSSKV